MIDSIIYYDADSKIGTKATALTDVGVGKLARFISKAEAGDDFDASCITQIRIRTKEAVMSGETQVSPAEYAPGVGFLIATESQELADLLWNLPNNICRLQLDRNTGKVLRNRVTLAVLRTLQIEPMFAGSKYDFKTIAK